MNRWLSRSVKRWRSTLCGQILAGTLFLAGTVQAQTGPADSPVPGRRLDFSTGIMVLDPPASVSAKEENGSDGAGRALSNLDAAAEGKAAADKTTYDPQVKQASGCCGGLLGVPDGNGYGCSDGHCVPGRRCTWCNYDTPLGKFVGGIYDCICCPDPCYEPAWIAEANQAFFQDGPRPVTQTRVRWDAARNYGFPDTAEFFWAKIGGKGPPKAESTMRYDSLSLYQEVAAKGFSFFIEMPYLNVDPTVNSHEAGFGDMNLGTKSVLLDCDLLLITFQFRTYIPIGNSTHGLGTGHVSLEPSLLGALKLTPSTYFQGEITEWIPIAGTPGFASSVFEYHASLNQSLWRLHDKVNLVGNVELNGYAFQGQYTLFPAPAAGATTAGLHGSSYINAGPGLRFILCNKCDIGAGMAFGFGNSHGPDQIYRTELRIRY